MKISLTLILLPMIIGCTLYTDTSSGNSSDVLLVNQVKSTAAATPESTLLSRKELNKKDVYYSLEHANLVSANDVLRLDLRGDGAAFPIAILKYKNAQEISLSGFSFAEIPAEIIGFKNLQYLNVYGCELQQLPEALSQLKHLVRISCYMNQLTAIPESIGQLPKLKRIEIFKNPVPVTEVERLNAAYPNVDFAGDHWITPRTHEMTLEELLQADYKIKELFLNGKTADGQQVEPHLHKMKHLKIIKISDLAATSIHPDVFNVAQLEKLWLWGQQINRLSSDILKLKALKELTLISCNLTTLPVLPESLEILEIGDNNFTTLPELPKQLKILIAGGNKFRGFPKSVLKLSRLEELVFSWGSSEMRSIPSEIGALKELRVLELSGIEVKYLPESLNQLEKLEEFSLAGSPDAQLPTNLSGLTALRELWLGNVKMTTLPEWIRGNSKIHTLGLTYTGLSVLPDWIGEIDSLKTFHLSGNPIQSLPASLSKCSVLERLELNKTKINSLPAVVYQLKTLTRLSLNKTQLTGFSAELQQLESLKELSVSGVATFRKLPETMGELANLQDLNLSETSISILPESITNCAKLKKLNLRKTSVSKLPQNLNGWAAMRTLYVKDSGISSAETDRLKAANKRVRVY